MAHAKSPCGRNCSPFRALRGNSAMVGLFPDHSARTHATSPSGAAAATSTSPSTSGASTGHARESMPVSSTSSSLPRKQSRRPASHQVAIGSSRAALLVATTTAAAWRDSRSRPTTLPSSGFAPIGMRTLPGSLDEPIRAWITMPRFRRDLPTRARRRRRGPCARCGRPALRGASARCRSRGA